MFLGVQYLNGTAEIIKLHRAIIRVILVNSQKDEITNVNPTDVDKVINIIFCMTCFVKTVTSSTAKYLQTYVIHTTNN